jgi:hypothetical protein
MVGPFDCSVLGLYGGLQAELKGDIEPLKRIQKFLGADFGERDRSFR